MQQTPPSAAEPLAPILHVGDHRALDFLNSAYAPEPQRVDHLRDGAALLRWLEDSGVVGMEVVQAARGFTPSQLQSLAGGARQLRETFRALLERWLADGPQGVQPQDVAPLNTLLARSRVTQQIEATPGGLHLHLLRPIDGPGAVLAELAAACAELLATHQPEQVRHCEGPACTLVFADTKRGPRRRWCSMALCGNRMKVAAHRARQRGEPAA